MPSRTNLPLSLLRLLVCQGYGGLSLGAIALIQTAVPFVILIFLVAHLYLAITASMES
ncbi:MAG: hypothetical protein K1562_12015 [Candidatus Thiodiazotropha sp. (ex. Lucinisca nassula)]|nr:hypothetical protein [Candidatus Thiodiazotropha sp. (ex. Lucinisca nassula)]